MTFSSATLRSESYNCDSLLRGIAQFRQRAVPDNRAVCPIPSISTTSLRRMNSMTTHVEHLDCCNTIVEELGLFMREVKHSKTVLLGIRLIRLFGFLLACAAGSALAQLATTTAVTSVLNPSAAGQSVGLVGTVRSAVLTATFTAGVGRTANSGTYYRYELVDAKFAAQVVSANLTTTTVPPSFSNIVVAQGGGIGERYVVFQTTAGSNGIAQTVDISFNLRPDAQLSTSTVTFSVHETASSSFGATPANTTVLSGPTTKLLSALQPPSAITGTMSFLINGATVPACTALPIAAGAAQCNNVFANGGTYTVAANYNGNFAASSGTLLGGQVVSLEISPLVLSDATVALAYSQALTANGATLPISFSFVSGTLPVGLTLDGGGLLSGTPLSSGPFEFFVRANDAVGNTITRKLSLTVTKGTQTVTFNPPANAVVGSSITLAAVASSGLLVDYSISTQTVCTVAGSVLRFIAAGTCVLTPLQNGDSNYFAAPATPRSIVVLVAGGIQPLRLRSSSPALSVNGSLVSNLLQFTPVTDPGASFRTVGLIDIDGDKSPDLIYQNTNQGEFGEARVWQNVNPANERVLRSVKLTWRVDAGGDLDGDGFGDIVWRFTGQSPNIDDTGVSYVWFTNGVGVTQVRKRGGAPLSWRLLGAQDLNGDGAADMIYISPNNEIRALMATPGRTCANLSAGTIPAGFTALKLGTFLRSGRAEILIRNNATGEVRLIVLDASGLTLPTFAGDPSDPNAACTSSSLGVASTVLSFASTDTGLQFFGTADFNGDGFLDIVWIRADNTTTVWLTSGDNLPLTAITNAGTIPAGYTPIQP